MLNAKDEANEIIKELNNDEIDLKKANKLRLDLNDALNNITPTTNNTASLSKENISIGQTVFIKKLNQNATVLTLPNKSNQLQVQFGVITMNVKLEDLALPTNTVNAQKATHSSTSFKNSFKAKNISPEINVIGMTVDEAIPIIDKYLDDASMSGLASIRIVHGKGTGKLRSGIHQFLKSNKHTKSFRLGTFGEGEMGVTVVELR